MGDDALPLVHVLKGTTNGAISHVSLNFSEARELRESAIDRFMTALDGNPTGFGRVRYTPCDQPELYGFMLALEFPTRNEPMLDSLLRVVAGHLGYRMHMETRSIDLLRAVAGSLFGPQNQE